jgi:tetratricopeptide (TPR) repeat protein
MGIYFEGSKMIETFIYTRSLEIAIAILAGAFLCLLGYLLFRHGLTEKSDLDLEFRKLKLKIFSATPGLFFALFGTVILSISLWRSAHFTEERQFPDGSLVRTVIEKGLGDESNFTLQIEIKFDRALDLQKQGNHDRALAIYHDILKSLPKLGQVTNNLADIYNKQNDIKAALIYSKFATTVFPGKDIYRSTLDEIENNKKNLTDKGEPL